MEALQGVVHTSVWNEQILGPQQLISQLHILRQLQGFLPGALALTEQTKNTETTDGSASYKDKCLGLLQICSPQKGDYLHSRSHLKARGTRWRTCREIKNRSLIIK